ncbi:hypothetical protein ETB97_006399 [Aspergillus alliaceus]|uniref:SP-RING-type domain-containing protein n=1 Tax=Petromyces alliaceus TaxID=209559 RepID=A0A8H5ZZA4_PETAA|nr:hypothetical protein ETB97_006399 [Aspergillus burnettii]
MSPNHPHLPNICSNANSVESSNSTASIFLGGVRRSWMLNAANNPASPSHSVPTRTSYTDNSATATTTTTTVAADAADWTRQQGMRESSTLRVLPVPLQSQDNNAASLTTAPAAPSQLQNAMSPVTPGHPQQQSTVPEPSPWRVVLSDRAGTDPVSTSPAATTAATTPSFSTTTTTVPAAIQRSASYPTPCPVVVPSQAYDSSGNVNRNGASPSVAAFPSPRPTPRSHQSPVGITVSVSSPVGVGAVNIGSGNSFRAGHQRERSGAPQQLQRQGSHVSHSHSPALSPAFPPTVGSPGKQVLQSPVASRRNPFHNTTLDDAFYDRSMSALQVFENQLRQRNCLGNVEQPRAQLLTQACAERDPLFLAIHQVYCLHSLTPQEFFNVPGYTELQARGLDVIRRLLVENSRVSGGFLKWSAQFPAPLKGLIQSSPYRQAVEQAGQCLGLLAERWPMYVQQVRSRGFPPLVDELVRNFGITSGPLAYTIFLSTCRTLPGSKSEEHLKAVWRLDLQYYQQRCASSRVVSNAQIHEETQKVVQAYRSVSETAGIQHPAQSPVLSHGPDRGPMTLLVTRPTSTGSLQLHSSQMTLPTPQPGSSTSQGSTNASHSHHLPGSTAGSRGSAPHSMPRPSGTPISQPIGATMPSQMPFQPAPSMTRPPTNASASHPISISAGRGRRSSWANGAPAPQHPHPIPVSDPMSRPIGAPAQGTTPPSMVYPSRIAAPASERRNSSSMQAATPVQRQVATRPPPLELRNNGVGPSMQPVNLRSYVQTPQSPFSQPPRPPPTFLLPPPGYLPVNTAPPQPHRDALHQAHLRDPHNSLLARGPAGEKEVELYQYLSSFAVLPTPLGKQQHAFHWKFTLSREDLDQFPRAGTVGLGQRSLRIYVSGNRVYRLRCIKIPPATGEVAESAWSVAESVWPSVLYVHVNGVELFVRRRLHNGKDLPLDITDHLREGENNVSLHFIRSPVETNDMLYAMGIEVLEVSDMARAFSLAQLLPASECREKIRNRVSSRLQDDEISVVSDHLSVNLVDPFTARIFDRPVRGRSCQHQDCFDHLTWIQTRASKSGKRSLKNDWKCPICARDARPQHLVIDGYLQEVHSELARTNRLEVAKAILIKADGSWELKTEADTRVSSERGAENSMGRTASKRKATDNSGHSPSQKTKSERVSSVNGFVNKTYSTTEVIALD